MGAEREMREIIEEWNTKMPDYMGQSGISWKFNPANAPHIEESGNEWFSKQRNCSEDWQMNNYLMTNR